MAWTAHAASAGYLMFALALAMSSIGGCPKLNLQSYMPPNARHAGALPRPFVILFDGSAGSSWFADALDRHPDVFIAGYEPLEWVSNASYMGPNATLWQAAWLQTIWQRPAQAHRPMVAAESSEPEMVESGGSQTSPTLAPPSVPPGPPALVGFRGSITTALM